MAKYIQVKRKYLKSRKYHGFCEVCSTKTPDNLIFSYVDDCNASITYHAPYCCYECYKKRYGEYPTSLRNYLIKLGFKVQINIEDKTINVNGKTFELKGLDANKIIEYFKKEQQQ